MLTDYERLPEFVPNLDICERVAGAPRGRTRIRQRGASQSLYWRLEAGATLEVTEVRGSLGRRELRFSMVEGDFKAGPSCVAIIRATAGQALCLDTSSACLLRYLPERSLSCGTQVR